MVNGILRAETELVFQPIGQQLFDGSSVCFRCAGDTEISTADIALQGSGGLVVCNFAADNIDGAVFF